MTKTEMTAITIAIASIILLAMLAFVIQYSKGIHAAQTGIYLMQHFNACNRMCYSPELDYIEANFETYKACEPLYKDGAMSTYKACLEEKGIVFEQAM